MDSMRVPDIISKRWCLQGDGYMVITLGPELEAALDEQARRRGVAGEVLVLDALRERFLAPAPPVRPQDEWERRLLGLAKDCGVSLSDAALSRKALYE
jgi:hypothetical protein